MTDCPSAKMSGTRRGEEQDAGHDDEGEQPEAHVVVVVGRREPRVVHPGPPDREPGQRVADDRVVGARRRGRGAAAAALLAIATTKTRSKSNSRGVAARWLSPASRAATGRRSGTGTMLTSRVCRGPGRRFDPLRLLPAGSTLVSKRSPAPRRTRPWATTRATCATSSSTSSRSSVAATSWGPAPTRTSTSTPRARCSRRSPASPSTSWPSPSQDADRNPPVYDPQTQAVTMPESFKASFDAYRDSGFWNIDLPRRARRHRRAAEPALGRQRDAPRLQPGRRDVRRLLLLRQAALRPRQRRAEEARAVDRGEGLALHDGARPSRMPGPTSAPAARRPCENDDGTWTITGVKRFITERRVRHGRQHRPLRAGPTRGRRPGHQGAVAVHPPQVRGRPRHR